MKIEKRREGRKTEEMETTKKSSHCWWFDSYNSDKCSPWLESTLSELNEKTNSMLKLIEEDADSFAQRAEMYYKKRPELISMVEEFYRAHRSLAERYDLLKSHRAARRSPLRNSLSLPKEGYECVYDLGINSIKSFDSFTEAAYSSEEAAESEIDDPQLEDDCVLIDKETDKSFADGASYDELMKVRDELDQLREENENQKDIIKQKDEEKDELVKLLSDNIRELKELREGMAAVREDDSLLITSEVVVPFVDVTNLKDERETVQVENMLQSVKVKKPNESIELMTLKNEMESLRVENIIQKVGLTRKFEEAKSELMKLEQEAQAEKSYLKDALAQKEEENIEVTMQFEETKSELAKLRDELIKENGQWKDEEKQVEIRQLKDALVENDEVKHKAIRQFKFALAEKNTEKKEAIRQLNDAHIEKDTEKNEAIRQLKNALAEKDEQKREAIRQLSVAMEILREESKLLKKSLVSISPKKKDADRRLFKGVTVNLGKLFNLSSSSQISVVPLEM